MDFKKEPSGNSLHKRRLFARSFLPLSNRLACASSLIVPKYLPSSSIQQRQHITTSTPPTLYFASTDRNSNQFTCSPSFLHSPIDAVSHGCRLSRWDWEAEARASCDSSLSYFHIILATLLPSIQSSPDTKVSITKTLDKDK